MLKSLIFHFFLLRNKCLCYIKKFPIFTFCVVLIIGEILPTPFEFCALLNQYYSRENLGPKCEIKKSSGFHLLHRRRRWCH
jgi:hypothetical protein